MYGYGIRRIHRLQERNGLLKNHRKHHDNMFSTKEVQYIAAYQQDTVMATKQSLIAAWHEHHGTLERSDAWNWSLHENYCSNIDLRWQAYTMYSIITNDNVAQFSDEGYASSPLLRVAVVGCVSFEWVNPQGESYPPSTPPQETPPVCTLLPPPEWYNAWKSNGSAWNMCRPFAK